MSQPALRTTRAASTLSNPFRLGRSGPSAAGLWLLLVSAPILAAQTLSTWSGGTGDWLNAGAWTPGGVPGGALSDVVIDNAPATASTVTFGRNDNFITDLTIGRLRIDTGDTLQFGAASTTLQFGPAIAFPGAGSLVLNGTMSLPWTSNTLRGAKSITGSGQLLVGSQGQQPEIYDTTTNAALIQGSARFGRANASNPKVINSGTIEANLPGQDIDFHGLGGADRSINTGTLQAVGGGKMQFGQGEWLNTGGLVKADGAGADGAGSQVAFYRGGLIEGGTISATNGGFLQVGGSFNGENGGATFKNVTLNGPTQLVQELQVSETLTNNGVMTIPSGAQLVNATNSATIAGTGEITLNAPEDDSPELINQGNRDLPSVPWLFDGVKVRGRGNVGYRQSEGAIDNVAITNQGTFEANVDGQTLQINVANFDNRSGGLLRAIGSGNSPLGGVLRLSFNGPLKNTGGTIEALNTGRVEAGKVRVEGGLVRNVGGFIDLNGWTLVNPGTGMRLEGDLKLGLSGANQEAEIIGEIANTGTLRVASSNNYARIRIGTSPTRTASLSGDGELVLGDPTSSSMESGLMEVFGNSETSTLNNLDHTIRGFGRIGDPGYDRWLILNNHGLVKADVPNKNLSIQLHSASNSGGTFRASGGGLMSLYARNGFNNTGGIIEAFSSGEVSFAAATPVTNGTLKNSAGMFDLANATLINDGAGITLQGPLIIRDTGAAGLVGTIQNEGSVRLLNSSDNTRTRLRIGSSGTNSVTLNSPPGNVPGGELILGDPVLGGSAASVEADDGASNPTLTLNQTMRGFGVVGYNSSSTNRSMHLINNSEVNADVNGKQLGLHTLTVLNSPGKSLKATNGGTLYFNPDQLTNTNATISAAAASAIAFDIQTTLTGGNVSSAIGGSINVLSNLTANGGVEFTNAGTMNIGSSGGDAFKGIANGGSSIISSGTVRKVGNTDYSVYSPCTNTGVVNAQDKGAINVQNGTLRWKAGGQLTNSTISANSNTELHFQDTPFTFSGANTFSGAGNHWFGNSTVTLADAATLNVDGNFNIGNYGTSTLTGPGTMNINAGGTLTIHPGTSNFSGSKLVTLAGSNTVINKSGKPLEFTNGATWKNSGIVSMGGNINVLNGAVGTRFENLQGGVFRTTAAQENRLAMPFDNFGTFEAFSGSLAITANGTFNKGSTKVAAGFGIYASGGTVEFQGVENASTGDGFFGTSNGNFSFAPDAKLTGENIGLYATSNVSGAGTLEVTKNLQIGDTHDLTITDTLLRIAPTATATYNLPLSNGFCRLMNNAVFENAGKLDHYLTRSFTGDGTGLFRALEGSITNFNAVVPNFGYFADVSVDVPFDIAGTVAANQGKVVRFTKGGLFNLSAKILVPTPDSRFTFTGQTTPYHVTGLANEITGPGTVEFENTRIVFDDPGPAQPDGPPVDYPALSSATKMAFTGVNDNTGLKSVRVEGKGDLASRGFVFASSFTTFDKTTVAARSGGAGSNWIATNGNLTLVNGAKFVNEGTFTISTAVGTWTGAADTLFHNKSTGRLVHDSATITNIGMAFQNDGVLDFRQGTINFTGTITGTGGIAASGGAKANLAPSAQTIASLEVTGQGSQINQPDAGPGPPLTVDKKLEVEGGGLVNLPRGLLLPPSASATLTGANSQLKTGLIGLDGSTLIGLDGSTLTNTGQADLKNGATASFTGANTKFNNAGGLIGNDGSTLIGNDGSTLVAAGGMNFANESKLIGNDGSTLIGNDGSTLVAEGAALLRSPRNDAPVSGPGKIIARNGSLIAGNGTFTGTGYVLTGSFLRPGKQPLAGASLPGTMQWNGALEIGTGSILDVQIGGAIAGVNHDRLSVTQTLQVRGSLAVSFVNGFGPGLTPASTFDVVVATGGVTSALNGTRVPVTNAYGSFLVSIVNGTTLRLSDYQTVPATFNRWAQRFGLTGADALPGADPNGSGLSNLMKYALGLDASASGNAGTSFGIFDDGQGNRYLTLSYTKPTGADAPSDLLYEPQRAAFPAAGPWSALAADVVPTGPAVPGPGSLQTITVRSTHPIAAGQPSDFLRLRVVLNPPP